MSGESGNQSGQTMTTNNQQVVTTSTTSGQMTVSSQVVQQQQQQSQPSPGQQQQQQQQGVPQQQQLQLQQATATLHSHQQNQGGNPMQQLQLIQQPMQNPAYLQQLYNTQGQLLMSGNILHHGINPQIQVIAAAKSFQSNQLTSPHMLTTATSYTIPTSAPNNQQSYIIGPLLNSQASLQALQQHQQGSKPGEIQKIISPQIGAQLPQGLQWASPHNFLAQNFILRGGQPEQQQMYIQPQQHQHFSMPMTATANQLPGTSISPITSTTVQQSAQQQSPPTVQHTHQQHQNQTQHSIQPQQGNVISVKTPITLQPKPQIQPQPNLQQQQQQQQQQMQQHIQQVTMHQSTQQIQMIPQTPTSIPQSISITQQPASQTLTTAHVVQQQTQQQQPRQLTILPQQTQIQSQPVQILQTAQQPQPIRPNPSYSTTTVNVASTVQAQMTPPTGAQRPNKIRKPAVARGSTTGPPPQQQTKQVFPRMPQNQNNSGVVPQQPRQIQPSQGGITLQPLTRIPIVNQTTTQQQQILTQPLKTINMAALQQPNLPDATLTPLTPQSNPLQSTAVSQQQQQQSVSQQMQQVFQQANATQLPSPNISITPTNSLPIGVHPHNNRKEENSTDRVEIKADTEKENNKTNNSMEDQDDGLGKQKLPKAMVKPQVLTHVIEGFVIQEAAEPFPMPTMDSDEPSKKKIALSAEKAKCELCGIIDLKAKFKKNKRFCSSACAKGMKTVHQKHQQQQAQIGGKPNTNNTNNVTNDRTPQGKGRKWAEGVDGDLTDETNSSTGDVSTLSPNEDQNMEDEVKVNPMKWDVAEVVDFVKSLPGCSEYANDFAEHEIDGQALLLLKEDHLMSAMNMKLGPALKLCAKIEYIRSTSTGESART